MWCLFCLPIGDVIYYKPSFRCIFSRTVLKAFAFLNIIMIFVLLLCSLYSSTSIFIAACCEILWE